MADAVRERGDTFRICNGRVDSRATLHSTRGQQAAYAYFDHGFGIALRRSHSHWWWSDRGYTSEGHFLSIWIVNLRCSDP